MKQTTKNRISRSLAIILAVFAVFLTAPFAACDSGETAAERFLPNVVRISSGTAYGSGVITAVTDDGLVCLTNYHVIMNSSAVFVTLGSGEEGEPDVTAGAELLGYSAYHDVAVLKIHASAPAGLTEVRIAEAKEGKTNFAIGNADGQGVVVHSGECASRGVSIQTDSLTVPEAVKYVPVIKTTAAVYAGMSGGALLDCNGNLIGIASYGGSDGYYAVPSEIAMAVQTAALCGRVDETGRVNLVGDSACGVAYDSLGRIGVAVYQTSFMPMSFGFIGVFEKSVYGEGIRVTRTGAESDVETGDLITDMGGLRIKTDNRNAVFGELYKYATDGGGTALTVTLSDGVKKEISSLRLKA